MYSNEFRWERVRERDGVYSYRNAGTYSLLFFVGRVRGSWEEDRCSCSRGSNELYYYHVFLCTLVCFAGN